MKQFGLIGYPLSHSFSKKYFTDKFENEHISNCQYDNYPLTEIKEFNDLVANTSLVGLNVTIPYKQAVIPFLNDLDAEAEAIGAVNTIQIRNKKLKGFNTDVYGFIESLMPFILERNHLKALILGTGGASKAVAFGLKKLHIPYEYVSRQKTDNGTTYDALTIDQIKEHHLIINTTPLGMFPNVDTAPTIHYDGIGEEHILYDLVYNPEETLFLVKGKERGAQTKNGLEMLHLQAEKAWEIWNK